MFQNEDWRAIHGDDGLVRAGLAGLGGGTDWRRLEPAGGPAGGNCGLYEGTVVKARGPRYRSLTWLIEVDLKPEVVGL